jgi:hypothetical protein
VVEVTHQTGGEHQGHVDHDEEQERDQHEECSDQAVWMLGFRLIGLNRVDVAVDMPRPVMSASPGAMR